MPSPRQPSIATRSTPETKARFAALAASRGQSVATFLEHVIEAVLEHNPVVASGGTTADEEGVSGRMSIRLRSGDRELLNVRAAQRGMKSASYVAMLIHAHVRRGAPLPLGELNELKAAVGALSAVGRNLNQLVRTAHMGEMGDAALRKTLDDVSGQLAEVRDQVASLIRVNLESWEAGDA